MDGGELEIDIGMDSCAAEGSCEAMFYRGTSGDNIFNEGEKRVQFLNERGRLMAMTFQVAKVTRPLASLLKDAKT